MIKVLIMTLRLYLIFFSFLVITSAYPHAKPIKIIFDTDIDSDVDDVGALAMLHTLADNNIVEILGVIVTSDDEHAASCTDAINHFYQRPNIPIGVQKDIELRSFSRYTKEIANNFYHRIISNTDAEDATKLYRRLLSEQENQSVIIISVGHLTNMRLLLESEPDEISPLNGRELITKKVKLWSAMGGQFPSGKEANFYRPDPESTVICVNSWPTEVVFCGWEIGNDIISGGEFVRAALPPDHPVWQGYKLYNDFKGRASWDQVAVLYAVSANAGNYWDLQHGHVRVEVDGSNTWNGEENQTMQAYLVEKMNPLEIAKIIDSLIIGVYRDGF